MYPRGALSLLILYFFFSLLPLLPSHLSSTHVSFIEYWNDSGNRSDSFSCFGADGRPANVGQSTQLCHRVSLCSTLLEILLSLSLSHVNLCVQREHIHTSSNCPWCKALQYGRASAFFSLFSIMSRTQFRFQWKTAKSPNLNEQRVYSQAHMGLIWGLIGAIECGSTERDLCSMPKQLGGPRKGRGDDWWSSKPPGMKRSHSFRNIH